MSKKKKEPVELDYGRMPEHIWQKHFDEFTAIMSDVEQSLDLVQRALDRLSKIHQEKHE